MPKRTPMNAIINWSSTHVDRILPLLKMPIVDIASSKSRTGD